MQTLRYTVAQFEEVMEGDRMRRQRVGLKSMDEELNKLRIAASVGESPHDDIMSSSQRDS
jgi:hypothetical protein